MGPPLWLSLTCTPATAHKTKIAPSRTRKARSTSIVKSTCPGDALIRAYPGRGQPPSRTWCINNINCIFMLFPCDRCGRFPVTKRRSALDGYALLPLQLHAIHFCADGVAPSNLDCIASCTENVRFGGTRRTS